MCNRFRPFGVQREALAPGPVTCIIPPKRLSDRTETLRNHFTLQDQEYVIGRLEEGASRIGDLGHSDPPYHPSYPALEDLVVRNGGIRR